jgi:hypothetical protein
MQLSSFSRRANQHRRRVICLVGVLALGLSYAQATQAEEPPSVSITVQVERGLLSIEARNAPLGEVLEAIAKQANFLLDTKGDLDIPVTWSFADVPVDEGVQRLLHNISSVMVYGRIQNGEPAPLARVTTLRRNVNLAAGHLQIERSIRTPQTQQVAKVEEPQHKPTVSLDDSREDRLRAVRRLIRNPNARRVADLALLVSQDDDAVIRRIAAIGLGKLRTPEAMAALREALSDEDSLVRRRAIQGLGETWGKAAIEPLSIALIEDPEPSVRRQAALRLGQIHSEAAYQVLDAARFDRSLSVRRVVMAGLARLDKM